VLHQRILEFRLRIFVLQIKEFEDKRVLDGFLGSDASKLVTRSALSGIAALFLETRCAHRIDCLSVSRVGVLTTRTGELRSHRNDEPVRS
jgi:hypothetical protein